MSKVKSPDQKKALSLTRDRRNTYGENAKASRKNIPRSRQRGHQAERQAVRQALSAVGAGMTEDDLVASEVKAEAAAKLQRARAFKKTPDEPLGVVLERKRSRRKPDDQA